MKALKEGGAASAEGLIAAGDQLVAVNGQVSQIANKNLKPFAEVNLFGFWVFFISRSTPLCVAGDTRCFF